MTRTGLPHSDIRGSRPICGSPRLFAAYRVLLRLLTPRHPPYAFRSLTFPRFSSCVSPQGIIFIDAWFVILKCSENLCRDFSQRSMIFFHFVFCVVFKVRLTLPLLFPTRRSSLRDLCSLKTRQCRKAVNISQSRFAFRLAFLGCFRIRLVTQSPSALGQVSRCLDLG